MVKYRVKWAITITLIIAFVIFLQPLVFKKDYIERIARINLPDTAEIVDYKFGVNSYGVEPFYAKVAIEKVTFELEKAKRIPDEDFTQERLELIRIYSNYKSMNIIDVEEIIINEHLSSKYYFFLAGTTRVSYSIITKESPGQYYLYVLY